jgi:DNA-directed RNA polymerase specialized sigma24 family protein
MVCRNEQHRAAIQWDDNAIYGFVVKSTEYDCCLVDAVNSLPPICRKTVILFAFERIPREVIAAILQTSLTAVRFLIYRSGLLMREYLTDHGKQSAHDVILNRIFANWPYREYAQLLKLQKNMVFLKWPYSKL